MLLLWSALWVWFRKHCSDFLRFFLRSHRWLLPLRLSLLCDLLLRSFLCVSFCSGYRCRSLFRLRCRLLLLSLFRCPSCGLMLLLWSGLWVWFRRHCSDFLRFFLRSHRWLLPLRLSLPCDLWLRSFLCVSFCSGYRCRSLFRLRCRSLLLLPFRCPSCGLMPLLWSGLWSPYCRRYSDFLLFFRLSHRWLLPLRLSLLCGLP